MVVAVLARFVYVNLIPDILDDIADDMKSLRKVKRLTRYTNPSEA